MVVDDHSDYKACFEEGTNSFYYSLYNVTHCTMLFIALFIVQSTNARGLDMRSFPASCSYEIF